MLVSALIIAIKWVTVLVSTLCSGDQWGTVEVSRTVQSRTVGNNVSQLLALNKIFIVTEIFKKGFWPR